MSMFLAVLIFVIGLALIVKGGDAFVDAATWIAKVSGIPTFIIGATIVSLATTLPEMLVSAMAAAEGSVDMACGNAIGSVTANTGMILAIAVLAMPTVVKRSDYLAKGLILIACVSTLLLFGYTGQLKWMGSVVLVVLFVIFIVDNVLSAKKSMANAPAEEKPEHDKKTVITNILKFLLGGFRNRYCQFPPCTGGCNCRNYRCHRNFPAGAGYHHHCHCKERGKPFRRQCSRCKHY